jgi:hypothetical protein
MYLKLNISTFITMIFLVTNLVVNSTWAGEFSLGLGPSGASGASNNPYSLDTQDVPLPIPALSGVYIKSTPTNWLKLCLGTPTYSISTLPAGGLTYIAVGPNQFKQIEECPPTTTSSTSTFASRPSSCGNAIKEGLEQCDSGYNFYVAFPGAPGLLKATQECTALNMHGFFCNKGCRCQPLMFNGTGVPVGGGPGGGPSGGPAGTPLGEPFAVPKDSLPPGPGGVSKGPTTGTGETSTAGLRGQIENNDPRGQTASQAGNPQGQGSSVTAPSTGNSRAATTPFNPNNSQAGNQASPSGDNTTGLNPSGTQVGNAGNETGPTPSGDGTAFQSGNTSAAGAATNPPSNNGSTVTPPPTSGDNTTGFNSTGSSAGSAIPESTNNGGGSVTPPPANSGDNTTGLNPGGTSAGSSLPESGQSGSVSPPPSSGQPNQDPAKPNSGNGQTGHNQSSDGSIGGAAPGTDCDPGIQSNCQNR